MLAECWKCVTAMSMVQLWAMDKRKSSAQDPRLAVSRCQAH